ncbi:hypothetical protein D7Z26_23405 [Cohnella endophytica]|uniref:YviE n=1 Tax=Cohnella endophytica TaxID=2419778 RepID=A0A494XFI1_9BACL|nr:DUF6470 family protein [Cohnella endophytica]RKP47256.1 hypothetical protein D7Z26_23405 [Cohnella endophytica]
MENLRLSIHQTNALIGMESRRATIDIRSPRGELSIQQPQAKVEMESPPGELIIDSTRAQDALGVGPHLRFMSNMYSQMQNVYLQALGNIVQDGNRMAQITNPRNAFADIARDVFQEKSPIRYTTEASCFNVQIDYIPHKVNIQVKPQRAIIEYTPHKPEITYNPGNLDIYLRQKNSIQFEVTSYDRFV